LNDFERRMTAGARYLCGSWVSCSTLHKGSEVAMCIQLRLGVLQSNFSINILPGGQGNIQYSTSSRSIYTSFNLYLQGGPKIGPFLKVYDSCIMMT